MDTPRNLDADVYDEQAERALSLLEELAADITGELVRDHMDAFLDFSQCQNTIACINEVDASLENKDELTARLNSAIIQLFKNWTEKRIVLFEKELKKGCLIPTGFTKAIIFITSMNIEPLVADECLAFIQSAQSKACLVLAAKKVELLEVGQANSDDVVGSIAHARNAMVTYQVFTDRMQQLHTGGITGHSQGQHPREALKHHLDLYGERVNYYGGHYSVDEFLSDESQDYRAFFRSVYENIQNADDPEEIQQLRSRADVMLPKIALQNAEEEFNRVRKFFSGEMGIHQDHIIREAALGLVSEKIIGIVQSVQDFIDKAAEAKADPQEIARLNEELRSLPAVALVSHASSAVTKLQEHLAEASSEIEKTCTQETVGYLNLLTKEAENAIQTARQAMEHKKVTIDPNVIDALVRTVDDIRPKAALIEIERAAQVLNSSVSTYEKMLAAARAAGAHEDDIAARMYEQS